MVRKPGCRQLDQKENLREVLKDKSGDQQLSDKVNLSLEVHTDTMSGNMQEKARGIGGAVNTLQGSKGNDSPVFWRSRMIAEI